MNFSIERYIKEIRTIVPSYEGAKRGRGQSSLLSSLSKNDRKKFMFLENKIRLERNRIAAKKNRQKRKSSLEKIMEENENLKLSVDSLIQENSFLKNQIKNLKNKIGKGIEKEKDKIGIEIEKDKIGIDKEIEKVEYIDDFEFLNINLSSPIVFDS
jgi:regulator of replication initiation timing